jgi:hypothetical protein
VQHQPARGLKLGQPVREQAANVDSAAETGHTCSMARHSDWTRELRTAVAAAKYSTRRLAAETGIKRTRLLRILAGGEPRLSDAERLTQLLQLTTQWGVQ